MFSQCIIQCENKKVWLLFAALSENIERLFIMVDACILMKQNGKLTIGTRIVDNDNKWREVFLQKPVKSNCPLTIIQVINPPH